MEGGSIQNATNPAGSAYVQNVMYTANGSDEITLIVVDTNNCLSNREAKVFGTFTVPGTVTVTVNDALATTTTTVAAGDVIKITNNNTVATNSISVNNVVDPDTGADGHTYTTNLQPGESITLIADSTVGNTYDIDITITFA